VNRTLQLSINRLPVRPERHPTPMHILLVDHDRSSRVLVQATLVAAPQHEVTAAKNEASALKMLNDPELAFDVVMLDLFPNDPSGFELLRTIRSAAWRRPL